MATNYWSVPFSNLSPLGTIQSLNPSSDYLEVTSVNHQIKLIKLSSFFAGLLATLFCYVNRKVFCSETHINDNTITRVSSFGKCVFDTESSRFHVLQRVEATQKSFEWKCVFHTSVHRWIQLIKSYLKIIFFWMQRLEARELNEVKKILIKLLWNMLFDIFYRKTCKLCSLSRR